MLLPRERTIVTIALIILCAFSAYDLIEDFNEAGLYSVLIWDVIDFGMTASILGYVWLFQPLTLTRRKRSLKKIAKRQMADMRRLSQIAQKHLEGLGIIIDTQFDHWELTAAEKDVALLLLKGFSLKEVAEYRSISERTARQQATSIYSKSGMHGRAGLSAFFLEDLLLPSGI
ncbi:MAG: LuxR C-terminal-related transcriptional regulator [Litoreibacter sp.]|uniref:helix-turn-helix transcriptional regulator n=1 Tax=Litoreibacter sp. TaxID=1969459 RepID=UPI003296A866